MGNLRPLRTTDRVADESDPEHYWQEGYAIIRGLFSPSEIAEIAAATDQLYAEGVEHGRSFRHGNLYYDVPTCTDGMPLVRMVQWPSYHQASMNAVRLDLRIAQLLEERASAFEEVVKGGALSAEECEPPVVVDGTTVALGAGDALVEGTERGAADVGVEAVHGSGE